MRIHFIVTGLLLFTGLFSSAQTYLPFEQVRKYTAAQSPNKYDSALTTLTNRLGVEMHYLYPLYQAAGWESKFKKNMGEKAYYTRFSQLLAFAGDYSMAAAYSVKSFDSLSTEAEQIILDTVSQLKNIQYLPASTAIISNAPHYRVIMINESHAKPVHRAFTASLLEDLYKEGYRYLAMEAFNNFSNQCLDSVNAFTGYFVMEPVAGELVRKALRLGFTLVSYEDSLANQHSIRQRDSVQAENIYRIIQKDPSARILVHAGYNHISEEKIGDFIPMAAWFRKISGSDPFTIDQTGMTEGSEFEYGRKFYDYFNARFRISTPSILYQQKRPFNPLEEKGYDVIVMHPATTYLHNRPSWLSFDGERKVTLVQPTEKTLFFVQAYYENEYKEDLLNYLVPADHTYTSNREGYYCLFLRKGKYKLVLRDVSYKILSVKELEVE